MTYLRFKHKFLLHGKGKIKPKLSEGRYYLSSGVVGNYALFAGGYKSGGYSDTVEAFDKDLTCIAAPSLRQARYQMASAYNYDATNKYVLFGGGRKGSTVYDYVEAYNQSLTKVNCTSLSKKVYNLTGTRCFVYAMFAGGENSDGCSNIVHGYNTSMTYVTAASLPVPVSELASTSLFDSDKSDYRAVIGGGANDGVAQKYVRIYDGSFTGFTILDTSLSIARHKLAATSVGDYALFGGGRGDGTFYPTVDAFNLSGTRTSAAPLSKARMNLTATGVRFGGGEVNGTRCDVVDKYTSSLTQSTDIPLDVARYALASAGIGAKTIFAGGYGSSPTYSDAIDVYPK